MAIDPIPPSVFREAAPFSLPSVAATQNDRESQAEGQPRLEVMAAEQQVLRWMRNHLPPASRRRSRMVRKPGLDAAEVSLECDGPMQASAAESAGEEEESTREAGISVRDTGDETQEDTGTNFDVLL